MTRRLNSYQARNWIYYAAYFTLFIIAAAVFADSPWNSARKWVAITSILLMITIYAFDPGPRRGTLTALVRSRFRLCPHCRYDLSAIDNARSSRSAATTSPSPDPKPSLRRLGDEGSDPFRVHPAPHGAAANHDRASPPITCPECGRAFTLSDIRRHWRTDQGYSRSR